MMQYRYIAKERLKKATNLLKTGDDDDLTYACLELRKCIEALSYELLTGYLAEVPLKAMETWQPDKVMKELLRIDPTADRSSRIRIQRTGAEEEPDGDWMDLGEDRRLKASWTTKAYHQLGSFLHVPTIKQQRELRSFDSTGARERADLMCAELDRVLDTTVWNANFSVSVTFACAECEAPIKRRDAVLESGDPIECGNCGQLYDADLQADGSYQFIRHSFSWNCKACSEKQTIVQAKIKDGADVSCNNCGDPATLHRRMIWVVERAADKS